MIKVIKRYRKLSVETKTRIKTWISFSLSLFWSLIKIVISIITNSVFLLASAFFTLSLCFSKFTCLRGIKKDPTVIRKRYFLTASILIIFSGIFYANYNVRLLFGETPKSYGLIPAITIATISFYFIVTSIINLIKIKNANVYYRIIKLIAFIGALTDIMLTQMSLLMVEMPTLNQTYNVYFALAIGCLTILIGCINIIYCMKKTTLKTF